MRIRRGMAAWRLAAALILVWLAGGAHAAIDPEVLSPVPKVQDGRLAVKTDRGEGELPIHFSRDWSRPQPGVRRAVITVHGWPRRDLRSGGYAAAQAGEAARGTIVIAPQFLIQADIDAHHLPDKVLRWGVNDWAIGYDAEAPAALSSFDALDAILTRLADKRLFPDLDVVVIAGHSTGGRFVQHYAAIGHGQAALLERGVHIRYVVSNPSIYLYFTAARPKPADAACGKTDHWEYGLGGALPRYARQPVSPAALRTAYLSRDIVISAGHGRHRPDRVPAGYHLRGRGPGRDPFRARPQLSADAAAAGRGRRAKVVRGAGRRPPQRRDVRVRVRALRVVRPGAVRRDSGQALKVRLD
ncbi:hypothetical protein ACFFU8_11290 [Chromobacterium piscinae]|uniref:hypothetical protein n=1 Tax=Chromobacterium piscinae TaxID=686831 RepID=UPI001C8B9654|nr:hypothetical protein [Chromobacterium piscinae]MBX9296551.1 hypothetical protein [Chromobacterium vaccinii]MBX9356128.1 hypothetical protein [Chromobacterium vaccinii]MCD5330712.1 hypothetical protein [Chromobacterium piscinae]